jgi:hypothetical protein
VRGAAEYMARVAHIDESAPPFLIRTEFDLARHRQNVTEIARKFEAFKAMEVDIMKPVFRGSGDFIDNQTEAFIRRAEAEGFSITSVSQSKNRVGGRSNYLTVFDEDTGINSAVRISDHISNENFRTDDARITGTDEKSMFDQGNKLLDMLKNSKKKQASQMSEAKAVAEKDGFAEDFLAYKKASKRLSEEKQIKRRRGLEEKYSLEDGFLSKKRNIETIEKAINAPRKKLDAQPADRIAENVEPLRRPPIEIKDMDRLAAKQSEFDTVLKENPGLKVTLEDGSQVSLKELAQSVENDLAAIEAITTCRVA